MTLKIFITSAGFVQLPVSFSHLGFAGCKGFIYIAPELPKSFDALIPPPFGDNDGKGRYYMVEKLHSRNNDGIQEGKLYGPGGDMHHFRLFP